MVASKSGQLDVLTYWGATGKSAGVFETKQKAFHAEESLKLLNIEVLEL
jgi:hypothetical protein